MRGTKVRALSFAAIALGAIACGQSGPLPIITIDAGKPPVGYPDAGDDAGIVQRPDTGVLEETVQVSGVVAKLDDYLAGGASLTADVTLTPYGVTGVGPGTTNANGQYALRMPKDGYALLRATKPNYYPTSEVLQVVGYDITGKNLYIASGNLVASMATTYGVDINTPFNCHAPNNTMDQCKYAVIMGRIVDDGTEGAGVPTPVGHVTKAEFSISSGGDPTWYKKGPYFLGPIGELNATYLESQRERDMVTNRYKGGLYVTFVEMPVNGPEDRDFTITINSTAGGMINRYFGPKSVKVAQGTLAWAILPETGQGPPPPPPPPPQNPVDFDTQVYPLLLPLNQGGLGCQGCHTDNPGPPSGGMNLYGGPEIAYASLNPANYPQRVNLANPAASYVLVRPLYEAGVQDHPIYAFTDTNDPNYVIVLSWIQQGALRNNVVPPLTVSFYNEIRPMLYKSAELGGIGCYACHVQNVDALTAPGGFYMGGDGNELYAELTTEVPTTTSATNEPYRINKQANYVDRSLILVKPLAGSIEQHQVKIFYGTGDPRYQKIYTWIQQGYINDTP